ncbi:hypothetical protein D1871_19970 [Nakamurella silvestris]|nr:hypothetical protein D1871_19970 [Nakamurella silvestris]
MGRHSRPIAGDAPRGRRVPRSIRTKTKALLAGGLVLGIGVAVTMAAWTDNEFAQGTFSTSTFDTQSSVNEGVAWNDNAVSPGATMSFAATGMSPGTVRYAPLAIRTKIGSIAGTVALQAPTQNNAALAAALTVRVVTYASGTCTSALFVNGATYIVGSFNTPAPLLTAGSTALPVLASPGPGQAAATQYCFEVTLPTGAANTLQGQSLTAVWQLIATSNL